MFSSLKTEGLIRVAIYFDRWSTNSPRVEIWVRTSRICAATRRTNALKRGIKIRKRCVVTLTYKAIYIRSISQAG